MAAGGWVLAAGLVIAWTAPGWAGSSVLSEVTRGTSVAVAGELPSKRKIELDMAMGPVIPIDHERLDDSWSWQRDTHAGFRFVQQVHFLIDGEPVRIPYPAFADVYDVTKIRIWEEGRLVYLRIWGGDGAGCYETTFKVGKPEGSKMPYRLVERRAQPGPFPEDVWEITTYQPVRGKK
jgi:hypothetical protein